MNENKLFQSSLEALTAGFSKPLPAGGVFAIKSSAGVGKTALLVQLAIGAMAKGERVLHINIGEHIEKVDVWYKQLFKNIAIGKNLAGANELWETIAPNRFIMTFREDSFSLPRLLERTKDLFVQGFFSPQVIVVDGFNVTGLNALKSDFEKIKALAQENNIRIWLSINLDNNLNDNPGQTSASTAANESDENKNYDIAVQLQQAGGRVSLIPQKGFQSYTPFYLDPVTMLLE